MAISTSVTDPYDWWRLALADPSQIGRSPRLPVNLTEPQVGFYRTKRGDACAFWFEEGRLVAMEGARRVDPVDLWSWCAKSPVTHEAYLEKIETGRWPDDPPVITVKHEAIAGIGHNEPPDEFAMLKAEIEGNAEIAADFLKKPITDQTAADQAGTWAKKLTELRSKAEKLHKVEKAPHLEAGRQVDAKWKPLVEAATDTATRLKRHLDGWLREQDRLEQERQRKAREEVERIRREAEEAERRAAAAARAIEEADLSRALPQGYSKQLERAEEEAKRKAEELAQAEAEAQARKVNAGRLGAKVAFKEYAVGKITDPKAFLAAVADQPEIVDALEKIVGRLARNNITVAGMEIVREKRAA